MRIGLVTVYSHAHCTLKDVAGGFGTVFQIGESNRAKLLERAKSKLARLPSTVLGYIAAFAEGAGHEIAVLDIRRDREQHDSVPSGFDLVCVLTSLVDASSERDVMRDFRATSAHTIAIGAFATTNAEYFADAANVVVRGEPENLGPRLFDTSLSGIVEAGYVDDLDTLPWPSWNAFDHASFRYAFLSRRTTLPIQGVRGCAYGCNYCPFRVTSPFRQRSADAVVQEVAHLKRTYSAEGIAFRDPLFNLDADRVRALARGLRPLDVRFSGEMRADRLDASLLEELYASGLRSLEIGVESVNLSLLEKAKRQPPSLQNVRDVVRTAHRLGIRVIANFMFGLPDDTEQSIRETVAFAKELNTFAVQFTVATPYPGTALETRVQSLKKKVRLEEHTGWEPTFRHPTIEGDTLRTLREWAYVSYHYRPKYAARFVAQSVDALVDAARIPAMPRFSAYV